MLFVGFSFNKFRKCTRKCVSFWTKKKKNKKKQDFAHNNNTLDFFFFFVSVFVSFSSFTKFIFLRVNYQI